MFNNHVTGSELRKKQTIKTASVDISTDIGTSCNDPATSGYNDYKSLKHISTLS